MSFEEEWAGLVAHAKEQQAVSMQLNKLEVPSGSKPDHSEADLKVSQEDLAAIGNAAYNLHEAFEKDADHARLSSLEAASSLQGEFALGDALSHVTTRWVDQRYSLMSACAHISNHLDYTNNAHQGDETHLVAAFSKISTLDQGFDEGTQR